MLTSEYGERVRTYRGKGVAKFSNNTKQSCQVRIVQVEDGGIVIRCLFSPKKAQALPPFSGLQVDSVRGHIESDLKFETRGRLFTGGWTPKTTGYHAITLEGQEVVMGSEIEAKDGSLCRFSLVNFAFLGNTPAERPLRKGGETYEEHYLSLRLNLPWGEVTIHPVPNYRAILSRIKAQKGIAVTSEALIDAQPGNSFPEVIEKVDQLCSLLSLARGTKVNWTSAESITTDGVPRYVILKHCVTWPFSSLTLIDYRNPSDTPLFIEKCYPAYLRPRDGYNLDIAIEQYLDAKRETAYLETRGLAAVALIDSLQQLYASGHELTDIVRSFGERKHKIREYIKNFVTDAFPDIQNEELNEMLEKIPELNRRSFLNLLKRWTRDLDLQVPDSELSAIRDTRNSLAHGMRFKSTVSRGKQREYFRLINLINQVFLRLLGYQGEFIYVDLETLAFERRNLPQRTRVDADSVL